MSLNSSKKRKLSADHGNAEKSRRAPESGLANISRSLRGLINSLTGSGASDPTNPVVNGATPPPKQFLRGLLSDVASQGGRLTQNLGLLASLAESTLFDGGLLDDKQYQ